MAVATKGHADNSDEKADQMGEESKAPRFSTGNMDASVDPRKDFYTYANGTWVRNNPVPPDKAIWRGSDELQEHNMDLLHRIAEDSAADKTAPAGSPARLVGDFYASAMDTASIERLRFAPIDDLWQRVSNIGSVDDVTKSITELHAAGVSAFFVAGSMADQKNSAIYAMYLMQGGLSLPDRDYYFKPEFAKTRDEFREHVARMFMLKGIPEAQARQWADTVMSIETEMAGASRTSTELRDAEKNYNRIDTAQLDGRYGALAPTRYLKDLGVPQSTQYVVVGQPEFFDAINALLGTRSIDDWKVYLYWHVLSSYASALHAEVEEEDFDFFGRKLRGQQQQEPRWKRSIYAIDGSIGEALGKIYVERHFDEAARHKAEQLVGDLIGAFRERLMNLQWMSEPTRQKALAKLDKFSVKIGYPDKFRDYSGLVISDDDYVGNLRRSVAFELKRQTSRVGQSVDRKEWQMTPPTVNAYYEPTQNEIVFPAGILQPPFFDPTMDDAVNYGAIGAIIGHEITHGFDDQGRLYDGDGNLNSWWTDADTKAFDAKAHAVVQEYSKQEVLPGAFVNGELTLGENIADLGGVAIAYDALQKRLAQEPSGRVSVDGLTPEQRFFIAYAQAWRYNVRDAEARRRLTMDPHAPDKVRAVIPAESDPKFDSAFPPSNGGDPQPMPRVGVW